MTEGPRRVLVAGATGYLGKFAVEAFKARGYWVRALTRVEERLSEPGPFTAPGIGTDDVDEVFVGELTKPETLDGLMDGINIVFSSVGISRQRDGLTFEEVDYGCNHTLIELAEAADVETFVYVSMKGAEKPEIADLAITKAHEKVVAELESSNLDHRIVRPCGYFSDMGALLSMAKRGRSLLVGDGSNKMSPIHGRDLAHVCVDVAEGDDREVEAGGPEVMSQREAAELAFDVVGKKPRIHIIPLWFAGGAVKAIGLASKQFGDLAQFIVVAGEVDGVGPPLGTTTLRSYFEGLVAEDTDADGVNKPGPKAAVQLEETHDLAAFRRPMGSIPERVQSAIDRGERDGDARYVNDPNCLLDRAGDGDGLVDDVVRLADGRLVVACLTEMSGVSSAMWDWWFSWHSYTSERYRLWHPQDHVAASLAEDRRHVTRIRDRWEGNTSYVDEYIGGELQRLAIRFVSPTSVGLDQARVDEIGVAICARTVLRRERLAAGHLIHLVEDTADGCRMHSRFLLGDSEGEIPVVGALMTQVANTPRVRRQRLPERLGTSLLLHCSQEMNHLAGILAELHEQFGDE